MSLTKISINNIESIISNNSHLNYVDLKSIFDESNVEVREVSKQVVSNENGENELSDLYLLISKDNNDNHNVSPLQLECNGLILEKKTNKVVCMCLNKFNKITNSSIIDQQDFIQDNKNSYSKLNMEYCEDGTVIRLYNRDTGFFNQNQNWYTATTKCIDARKSYWSSEKTFDDMFWQIFYESGFDLSELDTDCTYSFILIHTENRIVINHSSNKLVYISCINNQTKEEINITGLNPFNNKVEQINTNNIIYPFNNYYKNDKRGIILKFLDESNNKWLTYQYDFTSYINIKDIRGNVPLIRMRYLELLDDPDKLLALQTLYSENKMLFTMINHCMMNLYKRIHKLYFESHVKHTLRVTEEDPLFRTLKQLHAQYKKQGIIVTFEVVIQKVNTLNPSVIKKLLNWIN